MEDGATGGENAALLLHAAAVVAQDFTFLAQVLRVLLALVGDVQAVGLLQRSLWKETDRSGQPARHAESGSDLGVLDRPEQVLGLLSMAGLIRRHAGALVLTVLLFIAVVRNPVVVGDDSVVENLRQTDGVVQELKDLMYV